MIIWFDIGLWFRLLRQWLNKDWIFSLTSKGKEQVEVLKILHGFTEQVKMILHCIVILILYVLSIVIIYNEIFNFCIRILSDNS